MLLTVLGLVTIQSCKKDEVVKPTDFVAAMPEAPAPAVNGIIARTAGTQTVNLTWNGTATNAITWDVYFGKSSHPAHVGTATTNAYTASITTGGKYYWQVVTTDNHGVESDGPVWSFQVNSNPGLSSLLTPANAATAVSNTSKLIWSCPDPEKDALTYDVYFGTSATPPVVAKGVSDTTFAPTMAYNTVYYWQIVAHDPFGGISTSVVKSFTTDVFRPDFTVFNGVASEICPNFSATIKKDVYVTINTTTHEIRLFLPLADGMVGAGWGTVYSGTHPIFITYDPVTFNVTSTKQLWTDSFIDPTEMGPMSLQVGAGAKIDATAKKISIKWVMSGNSYWGSDYTTGTTTYTMK